MKVKLVSNILAANERTAQANRHHFQAAGLFVINLMGGPGAGKTSFLEKTIELMTPFAQIGVIEGDIAGTDDAERLMRYGIPVVQINTGGACHLDAAWVYEASQKLPIHEIKLLFIENVGNLVCPAGFKLGEDIKVMLLSVTEGHDKPLKYPRMFQESLALIINKIDLLSHLNVNIDKIKKDAFSLNRNIQIFEVASSTGQGFKPWIDYLKKQCNLV